MDDDANVVDTELSGAYSTASAFHIEFQFGNVRFRGGEKTGEKPVSQKGQNQQLNPRMKLGPGITGAKR